MPSIQAAPAQVYPVGETIVPSSPGQQQFPQRTVNQGIVQIPVGGMTDPNTAVDFILEIQLPDNSWVVLGQSTVFGHVGGPQDRAGNKSSNRTFTNNWDDPITCKGIRMRVNVRDSVPGSGLATPASLGIATVTWN